MTSLTSHLRMSNYWGQDFDSLSRPPKGVFTFFDNFAIGLAETLIPCPSTHRPRAPTHASIAHPFIIPSSLTNPLIIRPLISHPLITYPLVIHLLVIRPSGIHSVLSLWRPVSVDHPSIGSPSMDRPLIIHPQINRLAHWPPSAGKC